MEWLEQMEAAEHRLGSARRASTRVWQLRHMRAAMELLADSVRGLAVELGEDVDALGPAGERLREPIRAGQW